MIRMLLVALVLICGMAACVDTNTAKIEQVMQTPLILPEEMSDTTSIINIIRYIKPKSCTSCELDLGIWRIYKKNIQKKFGSSVGVKFIVESKNVKETLRLLSMYNFKDGSFVDSIGLFVRNNKNVAHIGSDVVMLVDNYNNVILIADPCKDVKIRHLTDSVINKYVSSHYETTSEFNI